MKESQTKSVYNWLKDLFKSIGQALGLIEQPVYREYYDDYKSLQRARNKQVKSTTQTPKRQPAKPKAKAKPKTNPIDINLLVTTIQALNLKTGKRHHRPYVREEIYDEYDLLHDDEYLLYDNDDYCEDYADYDDF